MACAAVCRSHREETARLAEYRNRNGGARMAENSKIECLAVAILGIPGWAARSPVPARALTVPIRWTRGTSGIQWGPNAAPYSAASTILTFVQPNQGFPSMATAKPFDFRILRH